MKIPLPGDIPLPLVRPRARPRDAIASRAATLQRRLLWLIVALAIVRGTCYALITPPWQAPDETGHFEYIWTMAQLGRIPTPQDASPQFERELVRSLYQYRHEEYNPRQPLPAVVPDQIGVLPGHVARARTLLWGRFSASYLLPTLCVALFRDADIITQLYVARLSSIILNVIILMVAFYTFREIHREKWQYTILAVAMIMLMPYHTFINSTVGDGTLAELVACLVIYCWVRLCTRGFGAWEVGGIILGIILGQWLKATLLFLIPASALLTIYWLISRSYHKRVLRNHLIIIGAVTIVALLTLFFTNNPISQKIPAFWEQIVEIYNIKVLNLDQVNISLPLTHTYNSFWANFGDTAFSVSDRWHYLFRALSVAAVVGWLFGRGKEHRPGIALSTWTFVLTAAIGLFIWGVILYYNSAQGRYLLPIIVPFTFLFLQGLVRLVPSHLRVPLATCIVVIVACFDFWCISQYVIPYFFYV
jgi:hypothetical protein